MAIKPHAKESHSVSESESRQEKSGTTASRASTKARNAAAQQAQQEYLSKHINSNGPQDKILPHPLDFDSLPLESLRNYRRKYNLSCHDSSTVNGYILGSEIGKKSYSYKNKDRSSKLELANNVKKHFLNQPARENEIITNFLYKVKNEDKEFKLDFN